MEAIVLYLMKSAVWITAFTLVYLLFLRSEKYFILKRIYLVAGIIFSFIFPLVTLHYRMEMPPQTSQAFPDSAASYSFTLQPEETTFNYDYLFAAAYLAGIIILLGRSAYHILILIHTIKRSETEYFGSARLIRDSEHLSSFSFFNYVFVNPSVPGDEMREIINHELVHVKQKHWLDLLLCEFIRLLQWANPFVWIYTGFVRLNHEYLADEVALQRSSNPVFYKTILLNQVLSSPVISLSNSFNYSITKTRFEMMKKVIKSPYRKLKLLLILPVITSIFYAFAEPQYSSGSGTNEKTAIDQNQAKNTVKGIVLNESDQPLKGVTIRSTGIHDESFFARTGEDGRFTINADPKNDATLFFEASGYKAISVKPDFNKEMTVKMEIDPDNIYGAVRLDSEPVIAIDGSITTKNFIQAKEDLGYDYGTMIQIPPDEAIKKYGDKGKNGALEIFTRQKALEMGLNPPYPRLKPTDYPTFLGHSYSAFNQWVVENVKYPEQARKSNIEGWVLVNYTINPDGTIDNLKASGDAGQALQEEVVRVMESAPKFEPAANKNIKEPFGSAIAIRFKLPSRITGDIPFVVVQEMPLYPGGDGELLNYIKSNISYPEKLKAQKIGGRVIVRCVITSEGNVECVTVLRGVDPVLDEEAVKVIRSLKGFKPGMQGGKPVDVWYMIPVNFIPPSE